MSKNSDAPQGQENGNVQGKEAPPPAGDIADENQLYDLVIPPGTPQTIIMDITGKYEVELVERKERLHFANMDGEERELLAFRGKLDVMRNVEKYFYQKMKEFIGDT